MTNERHSGVVVITGASSGIGAACAAHLAQEGFSVFAGAQDADDAEGVRARFGDEVEPLVIDVTDAATIAAAADVVAASAGERGCAGLVNNAGIVVPGPLEYQPLSDFRRQLEVNLFGQLAVTQAFLPLIRQGAGRIVNVGSIGGRLVLPLHGAYSASKFAMEAVSDALRLELRQWKIHVALVDPGVTDTPIFGKTIAALDAAAAALHNEGKHLYDEQIEAVRRMVEKTAADGAPADAVAQAVVHALTASRPKSRYLAGKGAKAVATLARVMPDRVKDMVVAHEGDLPKS